ncbi:MAG: tail fiber assembly protein [Pseudomonadota bacterium]
MKEKVTIVPVDTIVVVNGVLLNIEGLNDISITDTINSSFIHAIQWANGQGHVEFVDNMTVNISLSGVDDYDVWVTPFVELWEAVKASQEEAQASATAETLATYSSTEARAERVRTERDVRITACDWVIIRHRDEVDEGEETTLTADEYAVWLAYRKALRDLPLQDGFPWDGGEEETPWPDEPTGTTVSN